MIDPDEEFHKQLLATFREEADEHLSEITGDLIALEKSGITPGSPLVERVYRTIHSLKGSARAVNLRDIESVCQNLESVFALMKKGEFVPDEGAYDLFHDAIKITRGLLSGERVESISPAEIARSLRALISMTRDLPAAHQDGAVPETPPAERRIRNGMNDENMSAGNAPSPRDGESIFDTGKPNADTGMEHLRSMAAHDTWDGKTVRIAANKLDRLIAGADDLLTTRLFITHRMQELEEIMTRFAIWRWNLALVSNDLHRFREASFGIRKTKLPPDLVLPLQRMVEFLEYNREFVTYLQHDLSVHVRAAEIDRSTLETNTSAISDLIHDAVLLPVANVLQPFGGLVREYSRHTGKQVDLVIEGSDLEMDRRILEALKDSLMHLLHNSIDHGIEYPDIRAERHKKVRGIVRIRIIPLSGSKVGIEVSDDGGGIDRDVIRKAAVEKGIVSPDAATALSDDEVIWLIFRSGLSTSPIVTDISGRGLGLAIVEDTVTRLGGSVSVSSEKGKGTTIKLQVPIRLATLRGVVVRAGSQVYVLPMQQVRQVIRVQQEEILRTGDRPIIEFQGEKIVVIRLTEALGITEYHSLPAGTAHVPIVIMAYGAGQIACIVDEVIRVQEIVVRSLGSQLRRVKRITGAVILGDGKVALVLDALELIQESIKGSPLVPAGTASGEDLRTILVVEDSVTSRALLQTILERAGYFVRTAVDGMEALAMLKEHEFDMVVSDVDMPRMSGFTLTEKIRADARMSALPVVLVTSLDSAEDQKHGITVGADAYIRKTSFEKSQLLSVIRNLLERKR
ncbi:MULTISPECIES: response regulator [unclassified Methanoregula]|uniref:hybrid sensor histidine kinase/response regulator n=1 Tax=unclassified Methanoregula TaxID=2649730 RepID=UPI0009C7AE03|nr:MULTISPECIES: response regulator [unclassified Methanoregula]OPX62969.1 MAG: chemotaxis protein CheA [Methanoregula sp. PtaB.Bin085]OPY35182.1 MAG: chemotaxis protein CheA [Methanoregula sp. PtaU1.Bin006]